LIFDTTFIITFLFTFAIVFGSLELTNIFKKNSVNMIIALVIAIFASSYTPFTKTLYSYLPYITWIFIIVFILAFIRKALGLGKEKKHDDSGRDHVKWIVIAGILLIIFLTVGIYYIPNNSIVDQLGGRDNIFIIIGLAFLGLMAYSAYEIGEGEGPPKK